MTDPARERPSPASDDAALVATKGRGTPLDFEQLFEDELDYVWHALRRLGVREADLDDEVNEVFLRVHRQFAKYDPSRPVRPWLFAFAARVAAEHRRLAHNRREVPGLPPDLLDPGPSTEAQAADNEARAMVLRALDRLDQSKREVFVAIELGGHSAPELALELGVPVNTVYSRLRLARDEFAVALRRLSKEAFR